MSFAGHSKREAIDLWSQILDRAREHEWSTFDDPDYSHPDRDAESTRRAFSESGWTEDEVNFFSKNIETQSAKAPVKSPGVAPFTELMLDKLVELVNQAATHQNIENRDKVHFVVEPKAGPFVSKINVVMTDQSIITMGSFFTRYCGLIARAYVRTVLLAPASVGSDFNQEFLRSELRKRPDLLVYWWRIFVSFALTGTHILTPYKPSTRDEVLLMEQVAQSMEIFGLTHEFGHHALNHGRAVTEQCDAHQEEFEADAFAVKMSGVIESTIRFTWLKGQDMPNPYLWTGAGGILLLSSLEVFRKVKDRIYDNRRFDTHPDFVDRSRKIKSFHIMNPGEYATSHDFCSAVENVLQCVLLELEPMMEKMIPKNLSDLVPDDWEVESHR